MESGEKINHIALTDINGRVAKEKDVDGLSVELDVADLPVGVYFLQVQTENGVVVRKVQINR